MIIAHSHFSLKPISNQDLQAVLEVYHQCEDFLALGPEPRASMPMVLNDLAYSQAHGGHFCGIYDPAGSLVGVVDVVLHGFEGNPAHAFITLLMIAQPFRRKGLGGEVVQAVEQEIRRNPQVEQILSGVQANNPAALRFWQRQGYQVTSGPTLQPDGTTAYQLQKKL
jgi:ribosomal protein S18 acetylase RimI-like enzyme